MSSYLARLRAQLSPPMSQTGLGEARGFPRAIGRKSSVENGKARLSPDEEARVAEIFKVPLEEVRANIRPAAAASIGTWICSRR